MKKTIIALALMSSTYTFAADTIKIVTARTGGWTSIHTLPILCKKYDLDVQISTVDPKMATTQLLIAQSRGEIDLIGPSLAATLQSLSNGYNTYIFSNLSSSGINLIARKDANINSFADLKGKKVASMRGSSPETLFLMSLEKNGMKASDVTLVYMSISLMEQAISTGQVDAAVTALPESKGVIENGAAKVIHTYKNMHRLLVANVNFDKSKAERLSKCMDDAYSILNSKDEAVVNASKALGVVMPNHQNGYEYVWTRKYSQDNLNDFVSFLKSDGKLPTDFVLPSNFNRTINLK